MADEDLLERAQGLSDLELAFLLCLMNREHCIISSVPSSLDDLLRELQYVCARLIPPTLTTSRQATNEGSII